MGKRFLSLLCCFISFLLSAQQAAPVKPRILLSTDIGGTDPDDNQSMIHLLMYSDQFSIEGLVSSPSYGKGSKEEIWRMIDLYGKDLPKLKRHAKGFAEPKDLKAVTKQGRRGSAPFVGYATATEGSDWIIQCARKKTKHPLWVLVWGGLEDLAQALHDAPDIRQNIRVYWIGGPNKKWSANSYAYIATRFPDLWFIENNASYYGFFSNVNELDSVGPSDYFRKNIAGAGAMGQDFENYYKGALKMGDTPSLLYLMNGDPFNPQLDHWGGSFDHLPRSPRLEINGVGGVPDTVSFCTLVEYHLTGPVINAPPDSICFWMETPYRNSVQKWAGYYLGSGHYAVRFVPKQAEHIRFTFSSHIPGFPIGDGQLLVENHWPGKHHTTDIPLGSHWFTDRSAPDLYEGKIQGGKTISKWRSDVLLDWATRWAWLR